MHTTNIDEFYFVHNGDYSGEVTIITDVAPEGMQDIRVPYKVLEEFVGRKYAKAAIEQIEQMTGVEYLDFLLGTLRKVSALTLP